jgi:hypothetical protein
MNTKSEKEWDWKPDFESNKHYVLRFSMFEKGGKKSYFQNKRHLSEYLKGQGAVKLPEKLEVKSFQRNFFGQGDLTWCDINHEDEWVFTRAYPTNLGLTQPRYEELGEIGRWATDKLEELKKTSPLMFAQAEKMTEGYHLSRRFGFSTVSPIFKLDGLRIREFFENFGIKVNSLGAAFLGGFFEIENNETIHDLIIKYAPRSSYLDSVIMGIDEF